MAATPVLAQDGKIAYHASPLVTAMIRGGVAILDEGNRMSEKSWASLAPLLDNRRYIESIVAGFGTNDDEFYITGLPVAEDTFGVEMFKQMAISAPLAALVILLLMWWFFRSFSLVLSPMIVATTTVTITMGGERSGPPSSRMRRDASKPSIPGILQSMSTSP